MTRLDSEEVGSPRRNAETLLMFVLGCDRAHLFAHPERELTAEEATRYDAALAERARGVPSQYITGHQEFWGLDFLVAPGVLIPRPETEHLVESALELAKEMAAPRIVDVGTGSGCIALALAHQLPQAEIHAIDISPAALEIARANAARLQLEGRVAYHLGDVLQPVQGRSFDFVVSNPPYVGEDQVDYVQRQVRDHEPHTAVFAGEKGLDVIGRLIPQAREALEPGGWLLMEIGYSMSQMVMGLLSDWSQVRVNPDLQGIPRVVMARR